MPATLLSSSRCSGQGSTWRAVKVNPSSVLLSGVMMFEHLGWTKAAKDIERALEATIAEKIVTGQFHEIKAIMSRSRELGMRTFDWALFELYNDGLISFEDAIQRGLARAGKTIRNIRSAWVKEQHVRIDKGKIAEYQVNMLITYLLED